MTTKKVTATTATEPASATAAIYITIAVLLVFALFSFFLRGGLSVEEKLPSGDSAWTIAVSHQVEVHEKGAAIYISPPWDTRYSRLFSQSLSHNGLRQKRTKTDNKRDILLIAPEIGKYKIETNFSVHVSSLLRSEPKKISLPENNRSQWLSSSAGVTVETSFTTGIVDRLSKDSTSSDETIEKLFNYVSNNIRIRKGASSDSEKALFKKQASVLGSNHVLLALLRTAHLPARLVTGVNLQAPSAEQPFYWVEVYDAETWIPLDPVHGYLRNLPVFYIPVRKGDEPLVITEKATVKSTTWKIDTVSTPRGLSVSDTRKLSDIFDLNRLSPANRENLGILLLLPLGVLATEIMRQLMGIRTYGTFTPSLMALAVVHVDRTTAIVVFLLVTIIGITIRSYLPNLNLQRTARLAMVFTLVSISMALVMSGFIYFDPGVDSIVVLLPVVVLTMLVDRIYTIADQRGMRTALIRLFWTVVAAFVSLFVLLQADWSIWLVAYPEIHALTLAVIIIIGLYQGPKLSEVPALSWLHEPESRVSRSNDKRRLQSGQSGDSK
jgi:transglutaminase-like putative cysteine protease